MAASPVPDPSRFVIVHATDLRPEGGAAFAHGLALAREMGAKLYSLYAADSDTASRPMPRAADVQAAWGDAKAVDHEAVAHSCCEDPVDTMLDFVRRAAPDLLVVGTTRRKGLGRLLHGSVSEALARNAGKPTLFVPLGETGFVGERGALTLRSVVLPVSDVAIARAAVAALDRLIVKSGLTGFEVVLLHVGAGSVDTTALDLPARDGLDWRYEQRDGDLVDVVVTCVEEHGADLVVMPTHGEDSLGDVLRGSHTERVMRRAPCPLLAVPLDV